MDTRDQTKFRAYFVAAALSALIWWGIIYAIVRLVRAVRGEP